MADDKTYIIDANNVCLRRTGNKPKQRKVFHADDLAEVISQIEARGAQWLCIADANFAFLEKETGDAASHAAWRKIQARDDFDRKFTILSGGQRADERILEWADRKGCDIISCDRYRDYVDKYPWLRTKDDDGKCIENTPLRVHQIDIIGGEVDVRWSAAAGNVCAKTEGCPRENAAPPPQARRRKLTPEEEREAMEEVRKLQEKIFEERYKTSSAAEAAKKSPTDIFFENIAAGRPSIAKTLLTVGGVSLAAGASMYGLKKINTP